MGLFDAIEGIVGPDSNKSSNDPNSSNFAGGSWNMFASDPNFQNRFYNMSDTLQNYVNTTGTQNVYKPDQNGFMPYQYGGMNQLAKNMFDMASASGASRGMLSPENQGNIVGSALTNALPNLFALQNQNQFIPGMVNQNNLGLLSAPLGPVTTLGQFGQKSLNPGMNYNNTNYATSNYWSMLNNIGSFWGGGGGAKAAGVGGMG